MSPFLLAVAPLSAVPADEDGNPERIDGAMHEAASAGAPASLVPDLFLTGLC